MWNNGILTTKAITGISQSAPAQVTAVAHGLVTGWRAAVVSAKGMSQINVDNYPPKESDWSIVSLVDVDNVTLDDVNSSDFTAYTSGGYLVYLTPFDLVGATAIMTLRSSPQTGTVLKTLTSSPVAGIVVDDASKVIEVEFATAAETWEFAYFDLEVTLSTGRIVEIATGTISIT
jgi:hypothetical protein